MYSNKCRKIIKEYICTCKRVLITPKIGDSAKALIFVHTDVSSVDLSNYYNKQETDD